MTCVVPVKRVLVTGSRSLHDPTPVHEALWAQARSVGSPERLVVIEGRCPYGGADYHAQTFCELYGAINDPFPAFWDVSCGTTCGHARYRQNGDLYYACAGFIRNERMVNLGKPDVCLAFPRGESRGTRDCARRAKKAGIPVIFG